MDADDKKFLLEVALNLDRCSREGALIDRPEGVRYIRISDTLAAHITSQLRDIVAKD